MHDEAKRKEDHARARIHAAIKAAGGFSVGAEAIGVSGSHVSNAVAGRDSIQGAKIAALWRFCGSLGSLEEWVDCLSGNRRRERDGEDAA